MAGVSIVGFLFLLYIVLIVQCFLAFGTAYRLTNLHGQNGIWLFAWLFVQMLAASIPGLGIYLWLRYKDD